MNWHQEITQRILAHLNGAISEIELIHWAEDAFIALSESDDDIADDARLLDILGYIGAGNTPSFALSWATLSGFLEQLGVKVRVSVA